MGPLTSFLLSQLSEESVDPLQSKLAEKTLTPAEVNRLAEDLVAEWQTDPELKARSLALIGKKPKDAISHRDLEMMVRLLHATHSKDAGVLPEFMEKAKREGFVDPRTDDFSKNQAFGRAVGMGLLPTFAGAVFTPVNPKIGVPLIAGGLGLGALTYSRKLKKFRELQEKGLNPVTGKKHDPARIERTRQLVQRIRKNKNDREAVKEIDAQIFEDLGIKQAEVEYHGKTFPGYNHPVPSDKKEKKMMVLAKKGDQVKLVHFGQKGYQHNYSPEAKQNYLTRSAGIRNKSGELTKDDPFSPNYWARKVLWPKGKTGEGSNGPVKTEVRVSSEKKASLADFLEKRAAHFQGSAHEGRSTEDLTDELSRVRRQLANTNSMSEGLAPWQHGLVVAAPAAVLMHRLTGGNGAATLLASGLGGAAGFGAGKYGLERREAAIARLLVERGTEKTVNEKRAAELSDAAREKIPASEFAVSKRLAKKSGDEVRAGEEGKYPIPDRAHARNALARVAQHGTPAEVAAVKAKVKKAFPDIAVDGEKKASLFDAIAARKENERWAASAKLAADDNFGHGAELAGLGILAVPAAASVIGKKFKMPALHRFGERDAVKHTTELVGLGTLAAPSVSHFMKKKPATPGQQ